jgi:hypothetical protein
MDIEEEVALLRAQVVELTYAIQALYETMGLDRVDLPKDPSELDLLYLQLEAAAQLPLELTSPAELRKWVRTLLMTSPAFFHHVATTTGRKNPWLPFLRLADHFLFESKDPEALQQVPVLMGALAYARRHVLACVEVWGGGGYGPVAQVDGDLLVGRVQYAVALLYGDPKKR